MHVETRVEPAGTAFDPLTRVELEFSFYTLNGALKSVAALLGSARSIDVTPADLGCLLDLLSEKAEMCRRLSGFESGA